MHPQQYCMHWSLKATNHQTPSTGSWIQDLCCEPKVITSAPAWLVPACGTEMLGKGWLIHQDVGKTKQQQLISKDLALNLLRSKVVKTDIGRTWRHPGGPMSSQHVSQKITVEPEACWSILGLLKQLEIWLPSWQEQTVHQYPNTPPIRTSAGATCTTAIFITSAPVLFDNGFSMNDSTIVVACSGAKTAQWI